METLSFGTISRIYQALRDRTAIAAAFKIQHEVLKSWLQTPAFVMRGGHFT